MRSETILEVAEADQVLYPVSLLRELGIKLGKGQRVAGPDGTPHVAVSRKTRGDRGSNRLREALSLDPTRIVTLTDMEQAYRYRTPFVKSVSSFGRYLEELAKDYDRTGVRYATLSLSDILKPEWLAEAHRVLPELEQKYKVKIRFKAALWRHSDPVYGSPFTLDKSGYTHRSLTPRAQEYIDGVGPFQQLRPWQPPLAATIVGWTWII
jgi:hypothetical protein